MESDEIWRVIDEQRAELADLFETIDDEQWSTPSLCEGWTVRDVAAHLTHSHMSLPRVIVEATKSGFRFNAMVHRTAVEDTKDPREIAAALRAMIGSRRHVVGTVERDPLLDALVHGQDIAVPLGIDRPMPTDAAVAAAERLWRMRFPFNPRSQLPGIRLAATDTDFAVGEGQRIDAPIRDILMVLSGRRAPVSDDIDALKVS